MAQWELRTGTSVERLLFFSDAVVAVAITVLALPLFSIPGPKAGQNVLDVLSANSGQIITFVVTFFVMAVMWSVHNRVMNSLGAYDAVVFWLNMTWLIGFVFMPWPSTMFGSGDHWGSSDIAIFSSDGTGALYWWTMAFISGVGTFTATYISRKPALIKESDRPYWASLRKTRARLRGAAFFIAFLLAGATSLIYPFLGFYALLVIIPLNFIMQPTKSQRAQLEQAAQAGHAQD
jgi:uncharacterized membrane protein